MSHASTRMGRRLAAVLAADVVGYSRLMGVDEDDTLARLRTYRSELIDPLIAKRNGRIVKTTGDGRPPTSEPIRSEFSDAPAIDAVGCRVSSFGGADG